MALSPKEHAQTTEEISLLESVDVSPAGEEGATVVGVLIGTDDDWDGPSNRGSKGRESGPPSTLPF